MNKAHFNQNGDITAHMIVSDVPGMMPYSRLHHSHIKYPSTLSYARVRSHTWRPVYQCFIRKD
jgi:hypothetical protein